MLTIYTVAAIYGLNRWIPAQFDLCTKCESEKDPSERCMFLWRSEIEVRRKVVLTHGDHVNSLGAHKKGSIGIIHLALSSFDRHTKRESFPGINMHGILHSPENQ